MSAWAVSAAGGCSVAIDGVASNRLQKASGRSAENNVTVKSGLEGRAGSGYFPVIGATAPAGLGNKRSGGASRTPYQAPPDRGRAIRGAVSVGGAYGRHGRILRTRSTAGN